MMFWSKRTAVVAEKQQEADQALIMSQIGYMAAVTMDREAERVQRGHRRIQVENHFSEKMFGKPA